MPRVPEGRLTERGALIRELPYDGLQIGIFSGQEPHQAICARAAVWLEQRGLNWLSGNCLHYPGGIADVLSVDDKVAVEAGYTQGKKVVAALCAGVSVLVVPYPDEGGLMTEVDLRGYFFEPLKPISGLQLHLDQGAGKVAEDLAELYAKGLP